MMAYTMMAYIGGVRRGVSRTHLDMSTRNSSMSMNASQLCLS